jgi:L,D-transpeptidase catalytic domain/SPOR domain
MVQRSDAFFSSPRRVWPLVSLVVMAVGAAGLGLWASTAAPEPALAARAPVAPKPPVPPAPLPPAMITPPPVAAMLQSGTLIVISKASQTMFVFSDGQLWGSTPVSTGKRRHTTPSGIYPILQKRRFHRSNIYSNAPMPYMQRLTWSGIALHSGWVPGYPASHGCVRLPPGFAQALFKLTNASATTVVIGDAPLETDAIAQQFALTATLPVRSALAPPTVRLADAAPVPPPAALASAAAPVPPPVFAGPVTAPAPAPSPAGAQTIQLTAAASVANAEAYWAQLLAARPDLGRFNKSVEAAVVKSRRVYRLRISGADAHSICATLKREGIGCLTVS